MNNVTTETITWEGWPDCLRIANSTAEVIVTTAFGPRILRYGLIGGPNAFHVIPKTRGTIGTDTWLPYGGHRLWLAPEALPRSYYADNTKVASVTTEGGTVVLTNEPETTTGMAKEIRITLAPGSAAVRVVHRVTSHAIWPVTLAPWALSIVANGGRAVIPQEPFVSHDDDLLPARPLILWKFTEMGDSRWRWGTRYITLRQDDLPEDHPQKVGVYNAQGWAAHLTPEQAFIIRIPVAPGGPAVLTDQGSNFETYTEGPFQELETLGPLTTLEPGQSVDHIEFWSLQHCSGVEDTDDALDAALLPLVAQAKADCDSAFS